MKIVKNIDHFIVWCPARGQTEFEGSESFEVGENGGDLFNEECVFSTPEQAAEFHFMCKCSFEMDGPVYVRCPDGALRRFVEERSVVYRELGENEVDPE